MRLCLCLAAILFTTVRLPAQQDARRFAPAQVALPLGQRSPVVDGVIHEDDEWAEAARMIGMIPAGGMRLAAREAVSWLCCDGKRIYFAVSSEMPPDGELITTQHPSAQTIDIPVIQDDSVEVWLAPENGAIFQGLFNAQGAIFDRQYHPAREWRGDWQTASVIDQNRWSFEASVSLASLGVTSSPVGQTWGVRLARNWKRPWEQSCWSPLAAQWEERNTMSTVRWLPAAPVVQMLSLRTPDGGKVRYRLRLRNPNQTSVPVHIRIDSQPSDSQHAYLDQTPTMEAGQQREIVLDHPACNPEETIYTRIHITDQAGKLVYFHREFQWRLSRPAQVWQGGGPTDVENLLAKSLTLHASFDRGPDADQARGATAASVTSTDKSPFRHTTGLSGRAMLSGRACAGVAFANQGNFPLPQGTLSMWVRAADWKGPGQGDNNHPLFTNGLAGKGYFGVQMARQVSPGPYLVFYMIQYPWRQTHAIYAPGDVTAWKPDQWHWIVLTWRADEITLYIDGEPRGRTSVEPPLSARDLTSTHFRIGKAGGLEQTAIDEVMVFDRCLSPAELRRARGFCRAGAPDAWEAVSFQYAYYPYYGKLKVMVGIDGLKDKGRIRGARLTLRRVGENGAMQTLDMPPFQDFTSETIVEGLDLPEGRYQLALRLEPQPASLKGELTREFVRQKFEWEHNDIGKSNRILPPFTPLEVEGKAVAAVLRRHIFNDQGLWEQVTAGGEDLLAAPIHFETWQHGRKLALGARPLRLIQRSPTRVETEALWRAGDVVARVRTRMDYDGMALCSLDLLAGQPDRLDLVIPLKEEHVPLAHICGERTRGNFAGYLPAGSGVVWDSTQSLKFELLTPFTPYIWLGEEERGLCWFAESDRDWVLDGETPCQQIERRDGVVTLRVHLIQKPALVAGRHIAFGLQATPVKPMPVFPQSWRRWTTEKLRGGMRFLIAGSTHYAGHTYHDPFPYRRDVSIWKTLAECRRTGKVDRKAAEQWVDAYPSELLAGDGRERFVRSVVGGMVMAAQQPDRFLLYCQGRGVTFRTPEFQTFQDEWTAADYNSRTWPEGYRQGLSYSSGPVPSFRDYNLWWLKRQMEVFTDGLYFDCYYLLPYHDRITSAAYRLPDGRIQPATPMLDMREMMRRTSVMYLEAGRRPMVGPHMTNTTLVPVMSFAQFGLDWEWHYGRQDYQDRWTRDHIRAACMGRQTGCAPIVIGIGSKGGSAEEVEWLNRTFNGVILTHELIPVWYTPNAFIPAAQRGKQRTSRSLYYEIRQLLLDIGIGTPACRTYNYWQADYPLDISGAETASVVHRGEKKTVIIVTDWGSGGQVRVKLDSTALRLPDEFRAVDLETNEPVGRDGDALVFSLRKHDFKTILIDH